MASFFVVHLAKLSVAGPLERRGMKVLHAGIILHCGSLCVRKSEEEQKEEAYLFKMGHILDYGFEKVRMEVPDERYYCVISIADAQKN